MYDYDGDLSTYQKQLDKAGVDFDITNLAGCTKREIEGYAKRLIAAKAQEVREELA